MSLKILSIYDGFFVGGSRIVHTDIITGLHKEFGQSHSVLSLTNRVSREYTVQKAEDTASWKSIENAGIPIKALDRENSSPWTEEDLKILKEEIDKADIILSLKEQPLPALDMVEWDKPLVVSIHRSDPEHQGSGLAEMISIAENNKLTRVISCAYSAKDAYVNIGIPSEIIDVVENGINIDHFKNDEIIRKSVRHDIGATPDTPVIMIAARFDTMKNIPLFVQSAAEFFKIASDTIFITCGAGMTKDNPAFQSLLDEYIPEQFHNRFKTYGIAKTAELYPAADIVSLTSTFGEAAPLCILEGMSCGAIPVVTDVGDSVLMVGKDGIITSLDPREIADSWATAYHSRELFKKGILERRDSLSDKHMIAKYAEILKKVAKNI